MSILRYKKFALADGGVLRGGSSGGGSSGPTSSTTNTSNIPEYAQPYVMNMLQAAQSQVFNSDMTGINAYNPYSTNPQDYVAGFSPLQQQAQSSAANLQMPGQYGAATGQTANAGMASMNLAGQEANTGTNLASNLTNPNAVGAYMNPYVQNALNPAMNLLNQQYGMQSAQQQGAATQAGAFGGSRNALQQGLTQQNQMLAQNQLVGNAYNTAFNNAQQQMNNVSAQGLAGQQAAVQGVGQAGQMANQLAGIGGQELAAQQGIIGTQAQQGATQQANQQQIINQAVQNYATAQQYPMMQLANMSNLLRGLPMQSTSTQTYQAPPNQLSQLSGLGLTGAAAYGLTKKKGGSIKEKEGTSLADLRLHKLLGDKA